MSWFRRLFQSLKTPTDHNKSDLPFKAIPVVSFDPSLVTYAVKADIRKNLGLIDGLDATQFERIYAAALRGILAGGGIYIA